MRIQYTDAHQYFFFKHTSMRSTFFRLEQFNIKEDGFSFGVVVCKLKCFVKLFNLSKNFNKFSSLSSQIMKISSRKGTTKMVAHQKSPESPFQIFP